MKRVAFVLLSSALLAACSNQAGNSASADIDPRYGEGGNTAAPAAAAQPGADGFAELRPGRWEGSFTIKSAAIPSANFPGLDQTEPAITCITPEQVRNGTNPFTRSVGPGCRYTDFKMSGGNIEGIMLCKGAGADDRGTRSDVTGQYSAEWLRMQVTGMSLSSNIGDVSVSTVMRRVSDCKGDEPAPPLPANQPPTNQPAPPAAN